MSIYESIKSDFTSSDLIFHYTKLDTAVQYILGENCLRLGPLGKANDPFEYGKKYVSIASHATANPNDMELWNTALAPTGWSVRNEINRIAAEEVYFLSCCSSKSKNGISYRPGFLKMRMWAQYGDSFRGICLVLSKSALIKELRRQKREPNLIDGRLVHYLADKDNLESRGMLSVGFSRIPDHRQFAREHVWTNRKEILFTKSEDFRDEAEFRVLLVNGGPELGENPSVQLSKVCKAVILGDKFPDVYVPSVERICNELNLELKRYRFLSDMWINGVLEHSGT